MYLVITFELPIPVIHFGRRLVTVAVSLKNSNEGLISISSPCIQWRDWSETEGVGGAQLVSTKQGYISVTSNCLTYLLGVIIRLASQSQVVICHLFVAKLQDGGSYLIRASQWAEARGLQPFLSLATEGIQD